jgi:hypothetical protein
MGAYCVCGYSAQGAPTLDAMAQQGLYNMPAVTGVPCNLSWLEYYNSRFLANPGLSVMTALSGIKNAGYNKIGLLTLTDDGNGATYLTQRTAFINYCIANCAANGVDDLMRLDLDGVINVSGVGLRDVTGGTAFVGSSDFDVDLIHQTTPGYTKIAGYLTPVLSDW